MRPRDIRPGIGGSKDGGDGNGTKAYELTGIPDSSDWVVGEVPLPPDDDESTRQAKMAGRIATTTADLGMMESVTSRKSGKRMHPWYALHPEE